MAIPHELTVSRTTLEEFSRSRARGVAYDVHRLLCRLLGDFPAFVATDDLGLGPRLVLDGYWEAWVTLALARHVRPGMWCVDVGANYGYYTLLMAAAAGPDGRVLACEPHPTLAPLLRQNLIMNTVESRVDICLQAISDADGQVVEFDLCDGNVGSSSLARLMDISLAPAMEGAMVMAGGASRRVQVQTATLDRLVADWPRLDLVKIDVEGAEALVWEGMQQTLRRFPQVAVVAELHWTAPPQQALAWLHEIERSGYALRHVNYHGDIVTTDLETIVANPHEHWMLWLQK